MNDPRCHPLNHRQCHTLCLLFIDQADKEQLYELKCLFQIPSPFLLYTLTKTIAQSVKFCSVLNPASKLFLDNHDLDDQHGRQMQAADRMEEWRAEQTRMASREFATATTPMQSS